MRTFTSLLILLCCALAQPALAGDKSICDAGVSIDGVEYDKKMLQGLKAYGLCVAYQNADEEDKPALADRFFARADFKVPGSPPEEDPPEDEDLFVCPCWADLTARTLCQLGLPFALWDVEDDAGAEGSVAFFESGFVDEYLLQPGYVGFTTSNNECSFAIYDAAFFPLYDRDFTLDGGNPLTDEEFGDCRFEIAVIGSVTAEECAELGF